MRSSGAKNEPIAANERLTMVDPRRSSPRALAGDGLPCAGRSGHAISSRFCHGEHFGAHQELARDSSDTLRDGVGIQRQRSRSGLHALLQQAIAKAGCAGHEDQAFQPRRIERRCQARNRRKDRLRTSARQRRWAGRSACKGRPGLVAQPR